MNKLALPLLVILLITVACSPTPEPKSETITTSEVVDSTFTYREYQPQAQDLVVSRSTYIDKLQGFWLAQCIANWTGLITEMDKIGGEGKNGRAAGFYTRENWGGPDEPNLWSVDALNSISPTITFILKTQGDVWGADDDTDIEYMYQHLMHQTTIGKLTPEEIQQGWLKHIYNDDNTPFKGHDGETPENYLWVSNQAAHDLMLEGKVPPETSDPELNPHWDMIDAQLTTEIFGLFAPGRPDVALDIALLPIQTTARQNAQWIAEFYVIMHSLALVADSTLNTKDQVFWMAEQARKRLPDHSYSAKMYDYVWQQYQAGVPWEQARDGLHEKFQVNQEHNYNWYTEDKACNGCFAAGINFGASMVSLFFGEGDLKETIKIGALAGWDSDNPTATWGGLLGFMMGAEAVADTFGKELSHKFHIHRTRGNFPKDIDNFYDMAVKGVFVVDRVVQEQMKGGVDLQQDLWYIPASTDEISVGS